MATTSSLCARGGAFATIPTLADVSICLAFWSGFIAVHLIKALRRRKSANAYMELLLNTSSSTRRRSLVRRISAALTPLHRRKPLARWVVPPWQPSVVAGQKVTSAQAHAAAVSRRRCAECGRPPQSAAGRGYRATAGKTPSSDPYLDCGPADRARPPRPGLGAKVGGSADTPAGSVEFGNSSASRALPTRDGASSISRTRLLATSLAPRSAR